MRFYFELKRPHLKVLSAVCSNFVVVWLIALFGTKDLLILTGDILLAMLSWYLAIKAEEALEKHG